MSKQIRSVAEAIGIIEKEVEKAMGGGNHEKVKERPLYCIECRDRKVTHPGAYFCRICAGDFYNEVSTDSEVETKEETE